MPIPGLPGTQSGDTGEAGEIPGSDSGAGQFPGSGTPGFPGSQPGSSSGNGSGSGPLTPAEQVAILDAELERGMGEFDSMILDEQAAQRQGARERGE